MLRFQAIETSSIFESLRQLFPESSQSTLRSFLKDKRVKVNQKTVQRTDYMVQKGEEILIAPHYQLLRRDVKVLYQDWDLIVIEKPVGLLSVATLYDRENTAHRVLKRHVYPKMVYPVHRLDRETSGVMVFAFSERAREGLKKRFYHHEMERRYMALVEGIPDPLQGTWKSRLGEGSDYLVREAEEGKHAITHYSTVKQGKKHSLLSLQLETGRKHQIRVHCSKAGCPVVGDEKYGNSSSSRRLFLHAFKLCFYHPITNKWLVFESDVPEIFYQNLK